MVKSTGLLKRSYITPITTALFAIVSLTGVLMLLHIQNAMIKEFHEWMGLLFVMAAGVHLAANWSCFASYLRKPLAITLGVVVMVLGVLMLTGREGGSPRGRPPIMEIARRIETASLAQAAPLFGVTAEESLTHLRTRGLRVSGENELIVDIARNNGKPASDVINSLLAVGGKPDRGASGPTNGAGSPPPRP